MYVYVAYVRVICAILLYYFSFTKKKGFKDSPAYLINELAKKNASP